MSDYYRPQRQRQLFNPDSVEPFRLSRSKVDLFLKCPFCFYLDRRLGVGTPPGFPLNLNSAVDFLLKKEFDHYRSLGQPHPWMVEHKIAAVPFVHPDLDRWRENFEGIRWHHTPTNFILTGAVDDIWVNLAGELLVVDYKATSKDEEVTLDAEWQNGYKRQVEFYQWLLERNGHAVAPAAYFVYLNGRRDREALDGRLEFRVKIISHAGSRDWIEVTLGAARRCLEAAVPPAAAADCDFCAYRRAVGVALSPAKSSGQLDLWS
ncbi:MAG: PD-(D/E)XK nuclease family protein [Patescibacteria group bacterium]